MVLWIVLSSILYTGCDKSEMASPSPEGLAALLQQGDGVVHVKGKVFEDAIDLSSILEGVPIGHGNSLIYVTPVLSFEDCVFKGEVLAYREDGGLRTSASFRSSVSFINCDFKEALNLRGAVFHENVNLSECRFNGPVNLEEASFRGKLLWRKNQVFGEMRMQNAICHEPANFFETVFHENASFQSAHFHDQVQMGMVSFRKYADFTLALFNRDFVANYAESLDRLVMDHAVFRSRCELIELDAAQVSMRGARFDRLILDKAKFTGTLSLEDIRVDSVEGIEGSYEAGEIVR
jgi:uncharacterized protein YjbI with pentapeptide repeats